MNLTNRLFRKFAQWNLIEWKYEYYNDTEKEYVDWLEAEKAKLAAGIVEPPWVQFPGLLPWEGAWRQGNGDSWTTLIWGPFWSQLDKEERGIYLKKWPPPGEEWLKYITDRWYPIEE